MSNSATPWTAAGQASLSITNSPSLLKLVSIASVMPSNHLILCCPLLFPPSIFPRVRVFSRESVLHIRWPKNSSFSFSISPPTEYWILRWKSKHALSWNEAHSFLAWTLEANLATVHFPSLTSHSFCTLNIYWKDWCWSWSSNTLATWCEDLTHWKRPWCWERLKAGGEEDNRGDGWMVSPTQWTWVWVNSGSWWWTVRPGMLQSMGLQRVGHNWATELNWTQELWQRYTMRLLFPCLLV